MVVGHNYHDVEFVDLSGQQRTCETVPNLPNANMDAGSGATYFDNEILVCGGYDWGETNLAIDSCYGAIREVEGGPLTWEARESLSEPKRSFGTTLIHIWLL